MKGHIMCGKIKVMGEEVLRYVQKFCGARQNCGVLSKNVEPFIGAAMRT